jgi:hypothetical protein
METLSKTIKKLNDQEYQNLLNAVGGRKQNKPYQVLEAARHNNYSEQQMIEMLGVNPSAYYTLKSRLNEKVAAFLSRNTNNPISALKEKVALVPALLFGNSTEVSIRALKNLEKELIEYDLSNELITVYKALARLSMHNGDYDFYEREYNRHVAYSLAVVKAEDLFFEFTKRAGKYLLTRDETDMESLRETLRELENISELYHGHRLFVLFNIVRIYFLCISTTRVENLRALEIEIDNILQQIKKHFDTYELDTFYQSIRFSVDFLYFEYYTRTGNTVRAEHHYQLANKNVPTIAAKPVFGFYVMQFLNSKVDRFQNNADAQSLADVNTDIEPVFEKNPANPYPFISWFRHVAICKFYQGDYSGAARNINHMRNELSMKKYFWTDVECKLFQALNYCMVGEDGLCLQILQSIKRQLPEGDAAEGIDESIESTETSHDAIHIFVKMLKTAIKPEEFRKKVAKIYELHEEFIKTNTGPNKRMAFLKLDDSLLRRMANPIKD